MNSIYNANHCCTPEVRAEIGLPAFEKQIRDALWYAKTLGYDYNHVAMEMIQSITLTVSQMHIQHAMDMRKPAER